MGSKSEDFQVCTGDQRKHAISEGTQTRTLYTGDCKWQCHFLQRLCQSFTLLNMALFHMYNPKHIHPSVHLSYKALVRRWSATEETQALTHQPNHPLLTQSLSRPPPPPPPPPLSVRVKWSSWVLDKQLSNQLNRVKSNEELPKARVSMNSSPSWYSHRHSLQPNSQSFSGMGRGINLQLGHYKYKKN